MLEGKTLLSTTYQIVPIHGDVGGAYPYSMNDLGQVLIATWDGHNNHVEMTGPDGGGPLTDVGIFEMPVYEYFCVNDSAQIGGFTVVHTPTNSSYPLPIFLESPAGPIRNLGTLGGDSGLATGINDAGQVCGHAAIASRVHHAFLSDPNGGALHDLGTLGGSSSFANGVNNFGSVTGRSTLASGASHAFLSGPNGGILRDLGTLGGGNSEGRAVNDLGQVAGSSELPNGSSHAFVSAPNGGALQDLGTLDSFASQANGINNSGQVVGVITQNTGWFPFLYDGGRMIDLRTVVAPMPGMKLENAVAINNRGEILVYTEYYGRYEAALLIPVTDTTAPNTTASVSGTIVAPGVYSAPVSVTLSALDPDDPSATLSTTFSLDGGPTAVYNGPIAVSGNGGHTLVYQSKDPAGNLESPQSLSFTIQTTLAMSQSVVNDGNAQRSNIDAIHVGFNMDTNLGQLIADGSITSAVVLAGPTGVVGLSPARFRYNPATYTLTVDLTVGDGNRQTILADGRYQLRFDTSMITATVDPTVHLTGDGGTATGFKTASFFRLKGDYNGDGVVSIADRPYLMAAYGSTTILGVYDPAFDLNGDGVVNSADYMLWTRLIGHKV